MKIGIIVQSRMNSSRLPGKVLYKVNGKPMLQFLLDSLNRCDSVFEVVVATSVNPLDDAIVEFCNVVGCPCHRGSLENVAQRFCDILRGYDWDAFVRICGDSPLLDWRLVDRAVSLFDNSGYDMVTNVMKRTFPKGQSVEVLHKMMFLDSVRMFSSSIHQEHITSYFYEHSYLYKIYNFESGVDAGNIQLSVDTIEDMQQFEKMVSLMDKNHTEYSCSDLLRLYGV